MSSGYYYVTHLEKNPAWAFRVEKCEVVSRRNEQIVKMPAQSALLTNRTHFTLGNDTETYGYTTYNKTYMWPEGFPKPTDSICVTLKPAKKVRRVYTNPAALQKTFISFGNDRPNNRTAYQDLTSSMTGLHQRVKPCSSPISAEILPRIARSPLSWAPVSSDFTYYGPSFNQELYCDRLKTLSNNKTQHKLDSVDATLLGQRRKMLTRTMVDYGHPGNDCYNHLDIQQAPPPARKDHIWPSVTEDNERLTTEMRLQYPWHDVSNKHRFYRGHNAKLVR